jgi:hypothetical protein
MDNKHDITGTLFGLIILGLYNPKANNAKDTNNALKFAELKVHLNLSAYFT